MTAELPQSADLLVVGAGVAGLTAAITAAEDGLSVVVLNKGPQWRSDRTEQPTATYYAQGGVAVVAPDVPEDSVDLHLSDTLAAGAGLTEAHPSRIILDDGWSAVSRLIDWGGEFDRDPDGRLLRTREGGHSVRRIIHSGGDATGAAIQRALGKRFGQLLAAGDVRCIDEAVVTELLVGGDASDGGQVTGVRFRRGAPGTVMSEHVIGARSVLLATGGAGHLYSATTNPAGATADGVALALRAGAPVADLEFIQFHPTMLYVEGARGRRTLVSEAVRGEGGRLVDVDGNSVTAGVHPLGDLAPRDVVANAVTEAMDRTGAPFVYLDIREVDDFATRFPTVSAGIAASGVEVTDGLIPVVPGAHYLCGGVITDADGRTGLSGLLAAGEVARTGLHGANRLASNSLLEGLVMGRRAARVAAERARAHPAEPVLANSVPASTAPAMDRGELQNLMTRFVALRRDADGLAHVEAVLADAPPRQLDDLADIEDAALTLTARAVVAAALARQESRGSHHRTDFSQTFPESSSTSFRYSDDEVVAASYAGITP